MIAIACSFAASTPIRAQQDDARLVVSRSANFGTFQYLILYVDGVHVADLGVNQDYEAVLPPGPHVLSVNQELQYCTHTIINAKPGMTYAFTARWKNDYEVYLKRGNGASKAIVAKGMPPATTSCGPGR